MGRLTGCLARPNDGTVALEETCVDGAVAALEVPHSHVGVLTSKRVATEIASFLRCGCFDGEGQSPNENMPSRS